MIHIMIQRMLIPLIRLRRYESGYQNSFETLCKRCSRNSRSTVIRDYELRRCRRSFDRKYIVLTMEEDTAESRKSVEDMCDKLLANVVIERYFIEWPEKGEIWV